MLYFSCLFFYLTFAAPAEAQFQIEAWTTEQGLPYKTVNSVLQTSDGYIWAATGDGLARFDGVRFTVFNTGNAKNLPTNRLTHLVETGDGSLWMAGENRGLIRYKDGIFTNYTTSDGLPSDHVLYFVFVASKNLLRVVTSKGMVRFDGERFVSDSVRLPFDEKTLPKLDNTGAIYVRQGDNFHRFTNESEQVLPLPKSVSQFDFISPHEDRAGNVWMATTSAGYVLRFREGKADVLTTRDGLPGASLEKGVPGGFVNAIYEDRQGNLWFGARRGGVSIYKNGEFRLLTTKDGLPSDGFYDFAEDREGGVWAATDGGGLVRFSPQLITVFSTSNGLSGDNVYPLMEDQKGAIWIGSWLGKGLDKYENGKFSSLQINGSLITSLFQDREGTIWVGSHNYFGKIEDGKFTTVGETPQRVFRAITEDHAGVIWFGDEGGELRTISDRNKEPEIFTPRDGLLPGGIYNLHEDRKGTLWIGTSRGLAKYENGRLTVYTEADGLSGNYVRSIYEDREATLWIGTFDNGVTRLKDGRFAAIRASDGLHDNGAFQILEDDFDRFWISSNRGIYRVNRQELNFFADGKTDAVTSVSYGVRDGMLDAECNGGAQPAGFKSRKDGRLWFPTQKGVVVIDPKNLPVNFQPPSVIIENCLLDRANVACGDIEILPDNDALEINYTGLSYVKPEQIKFKYKLEGLDADWIDAGTRRIANFTHLPPGDYVFRVAASNSDGVWNETGASLKISVVPPFYRTFWFLGLMVMAFAGILIFAYRRRISHIEKSRAAQEEFSRKLLDSQENERQRIASELHDSLGQELLIIKNWALIGLQNGDSDQMRSQFGEISETASSAIDEVREIAYNLRPYHLDELGLTKAVESMLERVSAASSIDFILEIDQIDGFFPKDAEINFYRIVQECVNNVVKHSGATETDVRIKRSTGGTGGLRLSVWDNGKGFDVNTLSAARAGQSGFGLAGIGERAKILGGKLTISSVAGEGTSVSLIVSLSDKQI